MTGFFTSGGRWEEHPPHQLVLRCTAFAFPHVPPPPTLPPLPPLLTCLPPLSPPSHLTLAPSLPPIPSLRSGCSLVEMGTNVYRHGRWKRRRRSRRDGAVAHPVQPPAALPRGRGLPVGSLAHRIGKITPPVLPPSGVWTISWTRPIQVGPPCSFLLSQPIHVGPPCYWLCLVARARVGRLPRGSRLGLTALGQRRRGGAALARVQRRGGRRAARQARLWQASRL